MDARDQKYCHADTGRPIANAHTLTLLGCPGVPPNVETPVVATHVRWLDGSKWDSTPRQKITPRESGTNCVLLLTPAVVGSLGPPM